MTISGTRFTGGTYGLYVANDNNTSRFSGLTVQNSTFTNVGGGTNTYAIYAEEMRDVVVEDSTFTGGRSGIGLLEFYASSGVAASNITIRRNVFTAFTGNALDLEVYLGGSTPGIGLENPITIEDNTIQKDVSVSVSSPAVFVRLPAQLANAAVNIVDNAIALTGTFVSATQAHGIQLRGNGPLTITGNTIDGGNVGGTGTTPPSSGIYVQSKTASTTLPSGTFSNVMPATVTIAASCNRIQGFRNGVSVWDSLALAYGGLQAGASLALADNGILGNDAGVVTGAAPPTILAESNYWGCPAGPTDPACDSAVGDVDADPFLAVMPACVACTANAECDDGLFCTGTETCTAGACVAGSGDPCVGGPACENLCNQTADDCIVPTGTVCRPAAGDCDAQETCTGLGGACPPDSVSGAFVTCRPAAGPCDIAETCDGANPTCPADAGLPDTDGDTVCDAIDNCDAAANPGQENDDSDALGNVCDPCTNVAGTTPSKAKLILSKLLAPAADDKLTFKGFFLGVPGTPTVNPVANGLRILITDSTGATPIDVTLPGGAYDPGTRIGWKVNGAATAWKYSNPTSPVNGVTKAQLKAYPSTPGKYKFAVKGKNGTYAVNPLNLPLTGTLVIDAPTAETGQCGETAFQTPPTKPNCAVAGGGKTVKCK